jgi:hypothetical protein
VVVAAGGWGVVDWVVVVTVGGWVCSRSWCVGVYLLLLLLLWSSSAFDFGGAAGVCDGCVDSNRVG